MDTYYHGTTRIGWTPAIGACLVEDAEIAAQFPIGAMSARTVYEVSMEMDLLVVEDRSAEVDRNSNRYPGDRASDLARYAADGVDLIVYDDATENGKEFRCFRIVSQRAVDAMSVVGSVCDR